MTYGDLIASIIVIIIGIALLAFGIYISISYEDSSGWNLTTTFTGVVTLKQFHFAK